MKKRYPYFGEIMGNNFLDSANSMGFAAFFFPAPSEIDGETHEFPK